MLAFILRKAVESKSYSYLKTIELEINYIFESYAMINYYILDALDDYGFLKSSQSVYSVRILYYLIGTERPKIASNINV